MPRQNPQHLPTAEANFETLQRIQVIINGKSFYSV